MAATADDRRTTRWYETIRIGDGVTLIHEPWIKPFFRCNIWHVRGRDRDLLFDSGLGHFSLQRARAAGQRAEAASASPATRISTISAATTNSPIAACTAPRPQILADPRNDWTLADRYATDEMFIAAAGGLGCGALPRSRPAPAGRMLEARRRHRSRRPRLRGDPHARPFAGRHRALSRRRPACCSPATSSMTAR